MVLSLAVALAVAAGPTFSGAATVGVSVNTANETVGVVPVVALRLGVTQMTPVGIVRGRLAAMVPFPTGSVVSARWLPWAPVAPNDWLGIDLGSFLEFERPFADGGGWRVRLEPFNPSMRLVSFDWANAVSRVFPAQTGFSPVLSVDLHRGVFDGFVSVRPTWRASMMNGPRTAYFDWMVGAKLSSSSWAIEARAGRFAYGPVADLLRIGIVAEQWTVFGATRISWNHGGGVDAPLDLVTYAGDPQRFERFFSRLRFESAVAATLSLEAGTGWQPLLNPESFMTTVLTPLGYADFQARVRFGQTRVFATARLATFSFIHADVPGTPRGFAPLVTGVQAPALWGFLGADTSFSRSKLTPGILLRVAQPATLTRWLEFGGNAPPPGFVSGARTVVLDGLNQASVAGSVPLPRFAAKASLRWTPIDEVALVGEFEVVVTPPRTAPPGGVPPVPIGPLTTQTQLFVQARF